MYADVGGFVLPLSLGRITNHKSFQSCGKKHIIMNIVGGLDYCFLMAGQDLHRDIFTREPFLEKKIFSKEFHSIESQSHLPREPSLACLKKPLL
jgi:hypothetical protein